MKASFRTISIAVALAGILLTAAILMIGIDREPEKTLLKIMSDRVDLQVRDVRYTEVGDSGTKWEITAETASYQKKENLAFFEQLTVRIITKDGRSVVLKGDRGRVDTASRDVDLEGHVVADTPQGDRFVADRLRYRSAAGVIEADGPVQMENAGVRVSGRGMVLSLDRGAVSILSQVRATLAGGGRERK